MVNVGLRYINVCLESKLRDSHQLFLVTCLLLDALATATFAQNKYFFWQCISLKHKITAAKTIKILSREGRDIRCLLSRSLRGFIVAF